MKHNYEERRQNRLENAERLAVKNESESTRAFETAQKLGNMIPFGQPILIGHHSEGKHRAYIKKINNAMRKSVDASEKSKYYANKAESIENNNAIFSDDPNAIEKVRSKIDGLEKLQELMKDTNKAIRKHVKNPDKQIEALKEMGFSEGRIVELLSPDFAGRIGYAGYKTTNNNANIRRLKQRLIQLEKVSTMETTEEEINGTRIVSNVEANRVQIFFPSIPAEEIRKQLKQNGFHWCRSEGAWQRHLNEWAFRLAKQIIET